MEQPPSAAVADLVRALKQREVPLPHEMGTFIALQVCRALTDELRLVTPDNVFISQHGEVVVGPAMEGKEEEVTRSVLHLLGHLWVACAPGVPDDLLALIDRGPRSGYRLVALRETLETALVSLNRESATHLLGRLTREAFREPKSRPVKADEVPEAAVDQALDALLGINAAVAHALRDPVQVALPASSPPPSYLVKATVRGTTALDEVGRPTGTFQAVGPEDQIIDATSVQPPPRRSSKGWVGWGLAATMTLSAAGAWVMRDQWAGQQPWARWFDSTRPGSTGLVASGMKGAAENPNRAPRLPVEETAPASQLGEPEQAPLGPGRISLATQPEGAQVLLRVDPAAGPLVVELGVAHEFVAIAPDGRAGVRRVVPAQADFEEGLGPLPSYALDLRAPTEVAEDSHLPPFPGPSQLRAATLGSPNGGVGEVKVALSQGYRLYKFLGVTPSQALGPFPTDRQVELWLFRPGFEPTTVRLSQERWRFDGAVLDDGTVSMALTLALEPSPS